MSVNKGLLFNRFVEYLLTPDVFVIADFLNSQSTPYEIHKEKESLRTVQKEHSGKQIVYISSTRVCDPLDHDSPCVIHNHIYLIPLPSHFVDR